MSERPRLAALALLVASACGPIDLPGTSQEKKEEAAAPAPSVPEAAGAPVPSGWQCEDWAEIRAGELVLVNNVWNKGDEIAYEQCVSMDGERGVFSVRWQWPEAGRVPRSYPSLVYGWQPWRESSTSDWLPRRLSDLQVITADYDSDLRASGRHNLTFDVWLVSGSQPSPDALAGEVMVWLETDGLRPAGERQEDLRVSGQPFRLYVGDREHLDRGVSRRWPIFTFEAQATRRRGKLPLHEFLDHLVRTGRLSGREVVASVELGSEVAGGSGNLTLSGVEIRAR